jgi:hypothetical protein
MTTPRLPVLHQLLSPFPVDAFTRQYDNRAPVLLRPVVSTPLDLPSLDAFVAEAGLRWPTVHLEDADGPVHPSTYTHSVQWGPGQEHHLVNVDALREGLQEGARVVFPDIQRHHGPTAHFTRAYESSLHMRGSATAVLSPAGSEPRSLPSAALHRHLLQCHGTRTCVVTAPDQSTETFEVVVGCALYVPPGHSVTTQPAGGPSLAIDLSMRPIRIRDLAAAELTAIPRDLLREPVPAGLGQDPGTLSRTWTELVENLLEEVDHGQVLESLVDGFVQSRLPMLRGQLAAPQRTIEAHTRIRRRPTVMYRITDNGSAIELRFHGKAVTFPRGADAVVQFIVDSSGWSPSDLTGVPPQHQIAIAQRLVSEGFCELVDP